MAKKKGKESETLEIKRVEAAQRTAQVDQFYSTCRTFIKSGAFVWCAYFVKEAALGMAGLKTEVVLNLLLKMVANQWFAWLVAGLTGAGYWHQLRANRKMARELGPYAKSLEKKIDPGRTSSKLLPTGQPKPEDTHEP